MPPVASSTISSMRPCKRTAPVFRRLPDPTTSVPALAVFANPAAGLFSAHIAEAALSYGGGHRRLPTSRCFMPFRIQPRPRSAAKLR
jgi:hypothetical protein